MSLFGGGLLSQGRESGAGALDSGSEPAPDVGRGPEWCLGGRGQATYGNTNRLRPQAARAKPTFNGVGSVTRRWKTLNCCDVILLSSP